MAGGEAQVDAAPGITMNMIARRNLDPLLHNDTTEGLVRSLRLLHTVRLDREGITRLSNLQTVLETHSLYLQENLIRKIENLDILKNLRFLSLSGNLIEEVQNLSSLQNLQFLDLSYNVIQNLCAGELPPSLLILDLTGNSCTQRNDYRRQILESLPLLQELDKNIVRESNSPEYASSGQGEEDDNDSDDDDDLFSSLPAISGHLSTLRQELLERSYERREKAKREHRERLEEMCGTPITLCLQTDVSSSLSSNGDSASIKKKSSSILNTDTLPPAASEKGAKYYQGPGTSEIAVPTRAVKTSNKARVTLPQSPKGAGRSNFADGGKAISAPRPLSLDERSRTTSSSTKVHRASVPSPKLHPATASSPKTALTPVKLRTVTSPSAAAQGKRQTPSTGNIHSATANSSQLSVKSSQHLLKTKLMEKESKKA